MKILVTGAAGFVGSHLCEALMGLGHEVTGLDGFTDYYSVALKRENASAVEASGAKILELDLCRDDLSSAVTGTEVVFHLAAQPGISATTPFEDYLNNNVVATHNLLEACQGQSSLRLFANISTSSVYGAYATSSEEEAPQPTSYYGVTKLAAEQLVLAYQREAKLKGCSLRLFSVYGPRERPEKLFTKLISAIQEDQEFPLLRGSEEHSRSYTFVGDAVAGLTSVLDRIQDCDGQIFNIGSDVEITTGRGIEIIEQIMGRPANKVIHPPRPGDQLRTCANIDKARRVLGYNPTTKPEVGLKKQVEWFTDGRKSSRGAQD
jgi:nucleoside-diphosphate-sugar epimerase